MARSQMLKRTAIITGGARGFGKAFATALALEGLHVVLIDRDGEELKAAIAAMKAKGSGATGFVGDVTDEQRMSAIFAEASAINGGIDILIITRAFTVRSIAARC